MDILYLYQANFTTLIEPNAPQVHIGHIIKGLQQRGHQVRLAALNGTQVYLADGLPEGRDGDYDFASRNGLSGNPAFQLTERGVRRVQSRLRLPYFALFDSWRVYETLQRNMRPGEVLHERYNLLAMAGVWERRKSKRPYILELNADPFIEWQAWQRSKRGIWGLYAEHSYRKCLDTADQILTVSQPIRRHLVEKWQIPSEKINVLPNGVDTSRFAPPADRAAVKSKLGLADRPVVVFVGGFFPWHASPELVECMVKVRAAYPAVCLVMVGQGPMLVHSQARAEALGLQDNIRFTGSIPHAEIPIWLSAADIAVTPYPDLGRELWFSPLKLFEYMATGLSIIASGSGQVSEIIRDGENGLLIPPGDWGAFADAIIRLLGDPSLRAHLGHNARQLAVEQHSWSDYIEGLEAIYRKVQ